MSRKLRRGTCEPVHRVEAARAGLPELTALLAEAEPWTPGEKLYGVRVAGRRGFVGSSGRLSIAPSPMAAVELFGFNDGLLILEVNGRRGILDVATREVIPPVFESADLGGFSEGLWAVQQGRKWGFIDRDGGWRIEPQFAEVKRFSGGLAAVRRGELWGFVDDLGELVIPPRFAGAGPFSEGLCACEDADTHAWGFVDRDGAWAIGPAYTFTAQFSEDRGMVARDKLSGFIDPSGHEVIAPTYQSVTTFSEGLAKTEQPRPGADAFYRTRYVYIDVDGEPVLELPAGDYPYIFTQGLAAVGRPVHGERRWGFVDRRGATVVSFQYDEACVFDELGFGFVRTREGWHVIDTRGEYLVRVSEDGTLVGRTGQLWP